MQIDSRIWLKFPPSFGGIYQEEKTIPGIRAGYSKKIV
jgi:hypothetical protein